MHTFAPRTIKNFKIWPPEKIHCCLLDSTDFFPLVYNYTSQEGLILSWRKSLSYRNQSIDLLCKSMDWFLYDNSLRHERVNTSFEVMKQWDTSQANFMEPQMTSKLVSRVWLLSITHENDTQVWPMTLTHEDDQQVWLTSLAYSLFFIVIFIRHIYVWVEIINIFPSLWWRFTKSSCDFSMRFQSYHWIILEQL